MANDQKFVFSDGVILRCQFVKEEFIPKQLLDLEDVVKNIKEMLIEKIALQKKTQKEQKEKENRRKSSSSISHIRNRLLLTTRTNSMPEEVHDYHRQDESTDKCCKTSVILRMSPMMRRNDLHAHQQRYSTGQILEEWLQDNAFEDIINFPDETKQEIDCKNNIKNKAKEITFDLHDKSQDYVHIATFTQFVEAGNFLTRLLTSRKTLAVDINVSDTTVISISYQQLKNFNQEFMMVNVKSSEHMLFLRPF